MTRGALDTQGSFEGMNGIPSLSRYERLGDLRYAADLVPASADELTEIMSIMSYKVSHGGAAQHIAEVVKHQAKADTNDKHRGPRKLIRLYGDWAADAEGNVEALSSLKDVLTDDVNPELILNRVIGSTEPGIAAYLRHRHLEALTREGFIKGFGFDPLKVKYKPDNTGLAPFIEEGLETWRVLEVVRHLPDDIDKEQTRMDFHHASLLQVEKHYPYLRSTAREALGKFTTAATVE